MRRRHSLASRSARSLARPKARLQGPFVLKADVEGAELEVLAGATEVLAETELVLLELSLFELVPGTPQLHEVVALMHQHGFVDRRSPVMLECDATSVEITDLAVRTFRPGLYRPIKDLVGRAEDDGVVCMRYLKTTEAATC